MFFKQYESEGLAHYSYMIGDQTRGVVIDPRRDIDVYLKDAAAAGFSIDIVLETHRNEDYLIGSCELEAATGSEIFHADSQWEYQYGHPVEDGNVWRIGRLKIEAMLTPGHTPGSMSYILNDPDGNPWMVFTGDALFSGDVGRVDLLGEENITKLAGQLYDSLFNKILPLGDSVLVCPAHGAGSVCGTEIAERTITSIGLERKFNPKLQFSSKEDFIADNSEMHDRPPYFRTMEALNLSGPPLLHSLPLLKPLPPAKFKELGDQSQIIDTLRQVAFGAAHVPGSVSLWEELLPNFVGWFINYDKPLLLVCDEQDKDQVARKLIRMGFDDIFGYLKGDVLAWSKAGYPLDQVRSLTADTFNDILTSKESHLVLDVRDSKEIEKNHFRDAKHIPLVQLLDQLATIPDEGLVIAICPSGNRAMVAASLLQKAGWADLAVPVGGIGAWEARGYGTDS